MGWRNTVFGGSNDGSQGGAPWTCACVYDPSEDAEAQQAIVGGNVVTPEAVAAIEQDPRHGHAYHLWQEAGDRDRLHRTRKGAQ